MPKLITKADIIDRFVRVHGSRYDYSKVEFIGVHDKATILCQTHGEFIQRVSHHYSGHGCPYCGGSKSITKGTFVDNGDGTYNIPLTKGLFATIDATDWSTVSKYSWQSKQSRGNYYAKTTIAIDGKNTNILMHRLIMHEYDSNVFIDHRNHNGLDNTRINLRKATPTENSRNSTPRLGSSKYKGVCKPSGWEKWVAYITIGRKRLHLGVFESELDAALAYDTKAREVFGEYAFVNIINKKAI